MTHAKMREKIRDLEAGIAFREKRIARLYLANSDHKELKDDLEASKQEVDRLTAIIGSARYKHVRTLQVRIAKLAINAVELETRWAEHCCVCKNGECVCDHGEPVRDESL